MPSTRITIASNARQTTRSVVLIPASPSSDLFDSVMDLAKEKLRLKGRRVFREGGVEISQGELDTSAIKNDELLFVSSGEDYIGMKSPSTASSSFLGNATSPGISDTADGNLPSDLPPPLIRILAAESYIEPAASLQLTTTAQRLPGILAAIGMPDLHPGGTSGFPIGATIVSHSSVIYPPLIGGDIGCGMALYRTGIASPPNGQEGEGIGRKLAGKIRGIEGIYVPQRDEESSRRWLDDAGVSSESLDDPCFSDNLGSLGTIGGGNHFAELQAVHEIRDSVTFAQHITASPSSPPDSNLFLLVHSGSRGVGQRVLASTRSETQKGARPLVSGTPEFDAYMKLHDDACRWARCSRDLIAHRILGRVDSTYVPDTNEQPEKGGYSSVVRGRKVLDIWHNNVEKREWTVLSADGASRDPLSSNPSAPMEAWLHRKGAAPSDKGLVVIPGSRGAFSFLVLPIGPQYNNAFSLAHGAGRILTRSKAHAITSKQHEIGSGNSRSAGLSLKNLETTSLHSTVICEEKDLLFEEVPAAYKEIESVVKDLEDAGVIRVVAVLRPVVTYKVRKE